MIFLLSLRKRIKGKSGQFIDRHKRDVADLYFLNDFGNDQRSLYVLTTSATLAYLVPYLIAALFSLKLILKGETYGELKGSRTGDGIIALAALAYSLWVIVSGTSDLTTFILGIGLFSSVLRSTRSSTKVQK